MCAWAHGRARPNSLTPVPPTPFLTSCPTHHRAAGRAGRPRQPTTAPRRHHLAAGGRRRAATHVGRPIRGGCVPLYKRWETVGRVGMLPGVGFCAGPGAVWSPCARARALPPAILFFLCEPAVSSSRSHSFFFVPFPPAGRPRRLSLTHAPTHPMSDADPSGVAGPTPAGPSTRPRRAARDASNGEPMVTATAGGAGPPPAGTRGWSRGWATRARRDSRVDGLRAARWGARA